MKNSLIYIYFSSMKGLSQESRTPNIPTDVCTVRDVKFNLSN